MELWEGVTFLSPPTRTRRLPASQPRPPLSPCLEKPAQRRHRFPRSPSPGPPAAGRHREATIQSRTPGWAVGRPMSRAPPGPGARPRGNPPGGASPLPARPKRGSRSRRATPRQDRNHQDLRGQCRRIPGTHAALRATRHAHRAIIPPLVHMGLSRRCRFLGRNLSRRRQHPGRLRVVGGAPVPRGAMCGLTVAAAIAGGNSFLDGA